MFSPCRYRSFENIRSVVLRNGRSFFGVLLIDGKIRRLTPRKCARVQGFPESFIFHPKVSIARKQFGNSIAVPVVTAIVGAMIEHKVLSM